MLFKLIFIGLFKAQIFKKCDIFLKDMTFRVSVSGIDGSGKSTSISDLVSKLSKEFCVAKVGRPVYIEKNRERKYLYEGLINTLDKVHEFMDKNKSKTGVLMASCLNVLVQPSLEQKIIHKYKPDIIITSRDMSLCPAVYITYYLPLSKKIPTELRLKIFNSFRILGLPDLLFYLDIEPSVATNRISKRINEEKSGLKTERAKRYHMHENSKDLSELREYYLESIKILKSKGYNVMYICTSSLKREEVVNRMAEGIKKYFRM